MGWMDLNDCLVIEEATRARLADLRPSTPSIVESESRHPRAAVGASCSWRSELRRCLAAFDPVPGADVGTPGADVGTPGAGVGTSGAGVGTSGAGVGTPGAFR